MPSSAYYPKPAAFPAWESVYPRALRVIESPPELLSYPELPSPPRQPAFGDKYALSLHIIPAAYPRSYPDISLPVLPPYTGDKQARKDAAGRVADEILELHDKQADGALGEGSRTVVWNCVSRYVRRDLGDAKGKMGMTLFFAHANGFPKEIWETTIQHLLSFPDGVPIDEMWCWEAIQHGDAALINEGKLGGIFDWADNARDILNFLLNHLPSSASKSELPVHLPRLPTAEAELRKIDGLKGRTFSAVGHSFGGATSTLAALNYPALFPSLILVDPVIVQPFSRRFETDYLKNFVAGAAQRREHWASREEALRLFNEIPFFRKWDPSVVRLYVEHGLTPDSVNGGVRLKMSAMQEAVVFGESRVPYEVWELLERLDDKVELRWVMPGLMHNHTAMGMESAAQIKVWRRQSGSTNVRIFDAGHLIVQEAPRELAQDIHCFLKRKYSQPKANL